MFLLEMSFIIVTKAVTPGIARAGCSVYFIEPTEVNPCHRGCDTPVSLLHRMAASAVVRVSILCVVLRERFRQQLEKIARIGWAGYDPSMQQWKGFARVKLPKVNDDLDGIVANLEIIGIFPLDAVEVLHGGSRSRICTARAICRSMECRVQKGSGANSNVFWSDRK